jgi:type IV pilus assembly protein PilW
MNARARQRRNEVALTLVELLVAMLIGLLVIVGTTTVHQLNRRAVRTIEEITRLQDVARLAFDILETDVRMASHWGLLNHSRYITNRATIGEPLPPEFTATQGVRIDQCGGAGSHWAIDLDAYLDGSNNAYDLRCPAVGGARPLTDTLIVRRAAATQPSALDANRIYVQTSHVGGTIFVPSTDCVNPTLAACLPTGFAPATSQARALVAHAYYVASGSTMRPDVPALRRKSFGNVNAVSAPDAITDEEILSGVEDLQVRLGADLDRDGSVDVYVNPGAVPTGAAVLSVTIWLRIRALERDLSHGGAVGYQYADMSSAFVPNDGYRRIVVSRTLQLRNARP